MNTQKNTTPFIEVKNLTVHYTSEEKEIHAVNDVSFSLEKGETLGLVGETGAGKTTIAKSILRILPEPPAQVDEGEILLEGKNLLPLSNDEMRKIRGKRISMIFQDPMTALNPVMRVGAQIAEGIALHEHASKKEAEEKAAAAEASQKAAEAAKVAAEKAAAEATKAAKEAQEAKAAFEKAQQNQNIKRILQKRKNNNLSCWSIYDTIR